MAKGERGFYYFLFSVFFLGLFQRIKAFRAIKYKIQTKKTIQSMRLDWGAIPTINSIGNPKTIARELPTTKLLDAGVEKAGSTSLSKRIPVLTVPVIIPYIDKSPSR